MDTFASRSSERQEEEETDLPEDASCDGTEEESDTSSSFDDSDSQVSEGQMSKSAEESPHLSDEAVQECREAFNMFDRDGNGTISYEELSDVMRLLGNNPTEDEIKQMMSGLDQDSNGTVDFEEFKAIMATHWKDPVDEEEELLHAFQVFDRNKDGYVVADEIRYVMKSLGHSMTDEDINDIISQGDNNGDGRLDYHEFVKVMQGRL